MGSVVFIKKAASEFSNKKQLDKKVKLCFSKGRQHGVLSVSID